MNPHLATIIANNPEATDAEIAALVADLPPTTLRPLPLGPLAAKLRTMGLMSEIKAIAANPAMPQQVRDGLTDFLDHLTDTRQVSVDTTDPVIAVKVAQVLGGLKQLGKADDSAIASIYALGGGLVYGTVTEADVTATRAALNLKNAKNARGAQFETYMSGIRKEIDAAESVDDLPVVPE